MNKASSIMKARKEFTELNAYLRNSRENHFDSSQEFILQSIRTGGRHELRRVAKALIEKGIYAKSSGVGQVEVSIMKRLYRTEKANHRAKSWTHFVTGLIGAKWFTERRYNEAA